VEALLYRWDEPMPASIDRVDWLKSYLERWRWQLIQLRLKTYLLDVDGRHKVG
jgi:hypothetical protein